MTAVIPLWWIFFLSEKDQKYEKKHQLIIYALLAGGLLFFFGRLDVRYRIEARHYRKIYLSEQSRLFNHLESTDKYIIPFEDALQFRSAPPLRISDTYAQNNVLALAWLTKIPFNEGKLETYTDLIEKKMFAYKHHYPDAKKYLTNSILLHYNIKVEFIILMETSNFILFKIIPSESEQYSI